MVTENWGGQFEERFVKLEQHIGDLELIRITEIHDECNNRVYALESGMTALQGSLASIRQAMGQLSRMVAESSPRRPEA